MNYMKQIAEMLGVKLGEKFKVRQTDECNPDEDTYMIYESGVKCMGNNGLVYRDEVILNRLLNGSDKIVKIPWKPKKGEEYFAVDLSGDILRLQCWRDRADDIALYAFGNCYRTAAEAEAHKPEILQKMKEVMGE